MKVVFYIDNNKIDDIEIEKLNKKSFAEVADSFKENEVFFSESCFKNNLHLLIDEKDVSQKQKPLESVKKSTKVSIKLTGNFVNLEYGPKLFYFTENEPISKVFEEFNKFLDCKCSVSIYNNSKHNLKENDLLESNTEYNIEISHRNIFRSKKIDSETNIYMKYFSTIEDAKRQLSTVLSNDSMTILPEKITIYDKNQKKVKKDEKLLVEIQNLESKFYYDFKILDPKKLKKQEEKKKKELEKKQKKKQKEAEKKQKEAEKKQKDLKKKEQKDQKEKKTLETPSKPKNDVSKSSTTKDDTKSSTAKDVSKSSTAKDVSKSSTAKNDTKSSTAKDVSKSSTAKGDTKSSTAEVVTKNDKKIENEHDPQIIFIFDKSYPLRRRIPFSTTIEQVIKMIAEERKITEEIKISYETDDKERVQVDPSQKLSQIDEKMRQKYGNLYKNVLYVEIEKDDRLSKTLPPQKTKPKLTKPSSEKMQTKLNKYYYLTNNDEELNEIELDDEATVLTMKQKIAELNGIENLSDVKILFAGKELLSGLNLKSLEIGDIKLFVYIRTQEDVLLLTAKALHFNPEEEDEDEEEDNDDDDY